jgi:hypothetical protein
VAAAVIFIILEVVSLFLLDGIPIYIFFSVVIKRYKL